MRNAKEDLLRAVAPCSMMCHTCPACQGGAMEQTAKQMHRYLEGYYEFNDAMLPEQYRGWLERFEGFRAYLEK